MTSTRDATSRRPLEPADVLGFDRIYGAALAPAGDRLAYVVRSVDRAADAYRDELWLAAEDGRTGTWTARAVAGVAGRIADPCWSPDGRWLAFGWDASGPAQVHVLDTLTGETRQLTRLPDGASDPAWSPDGTRLLVTALDERLQGVPEDPLIRHVRRLPYRTSGGAFIGERFDHLWLVDAATGDARQLTHGPQDDGAAAWSPDGTRIAFISRRPERDVAPLWATDVFVIDADPRPASPEGRDAAVRLSAGVVTPGAASWSPDGTTLAFVAQAPGPWLASATGIWVVPADGSTAPRRLSRPSGLSIGAVPEIDTVITSALQPAWTPDGSGLLFGANEAGRLGVHRLDAATGLASPVVGGERAIDLVTSSADGRRLAYRASSWTTPGDLFVCAADGTGERRVTALNDARLAACAWSLPERLAVPASDGAFVLDAWLFRPLGFDPARTWPLVELMHGGPNGTFGPAFLFVVQLLASSGYNVLLVNPRGGLGYGEAFDDALGGRQGEADEQDLWDALDAAIAAGGVDPDRIGIHGHSYGGFMAAWMPGRTDRYRASVASAIMANFVTQSLTAYYGGSYDWTADGEWPDLWADPMEWWRRSPLSMVPRMRTPILFLLGESDGVTPPGEHDQLFTALRARGVETEMVRFVGAGHNVSSSGSPRVRAERLRLIVDWFDRYLAPRTGGDADAG